MDASGKSRKTRLMQTSLVLTVLSADRTGIVDSVSSVVTQHGGSWQESHMARLAGQFAGIVRITCPTAIVSDLEQDLASLVSEGLTITVAQDQSEAAPDTLRYHLDVLGNDRPGILSEVSRVLRNQGANIIEIETRLEPAPESGHGIFRTLATLTLPEDSDPQGLSTALESLSPDLQVSLS